MRNKGTRQENQARDAVGAGARTQTAAARAQAVSRLSRLTAIAAMLAIIAIAFGVYGMWRATTSEAVLTEETASVIVAATDLEAGHVVEAADLKAIQMAKSAIPSRAAYNAADVVGKTTTTPIAKNTAFTQAMTTGTGADTLAASIASDKVATTIVVNQQSGLAGMVHQGDVVDVYATDAENGDPSRVVARGATVLALNSSLNAYSPEYTAVTLEMTSGEAIETVPAAASGHIALVMQPKAKEGAVL